jgi:hypothetical protein
MIDWELVFEALNRELAAAHEHLELHAVGGFVLEYNGLKATEDVDAFYETNDKIDAIIKKVGDEFLINLSENHYWLNNDVNHLMSPPSREKEILIYDFTNLKVYIPEDLTTILLDKLVAGRAKDITDIAALLKQLEMTDLPQLLSALNASGELFDPAVLFESYSRAFGYDALLRYLNTPDVVKYLSMKGDLNEQN